ncbi:MAG: formyltetrahydrofolate deformylase [Chitinophagaceae bacterium]|nr:formyltetrahydrofolate deformylase [Chitinophagaceae bacterium]
MERNNVIRIKCSDQKGLIAKIAGVLYNNQHNIIVMKEFVETVTETFFVRLEISGELNEVKLKSELAQVLPPKSEIEIIPRRKKNVVILVTKEHHCLSDLLVRHYFNELHAEVSAVIGNHETLRAFAGKFNIPFHFISHEGRDRIGFEKELMKAILVYKPEYIVLAKFMRILSSEFVAAFRDRIINIHHSFLPAFKGANPYKRAFERGVKLIGATAHIVNDDLDEGPIITQKIIPVHHDDDLNDMIEAGHEIEKSVLADALKMVLEDRIFVSGNKTIIFA